MKPRDLDRDPFARMNDSAEEALAAATARVHDPRARQEIPILGDEPTTCSVCGKPAHASETDDLDRCAACADRGVGVVSQLASTNVRFITLNPSIATDTDDATIRECRTSLAQLATLPGTAPAVATGATMRELIALEHDDCTTCGCALDDDGACPNG